MFSGQVIVIADCCSSGDLASDYGVFANTQDEDISTMLLLEKLARKEEKKYPNVTVISSSKGGEVSYEKEINGEMQGVFTNSVIDSINSSVRNGKPITLSSIYSSVKKDIDDVQSIRLTPSLVDTVLN